MFPWLDFPFWRPLTGTIPTWKSKAHLCGAIDKLHGTRSRSLHLLIPPASKHQTARSHDTSCRQFGRYSSEPLYTYTRSFNWFQYSTPYLLYNETTANMGGSLSKMMDRIFGSREMRVLMLGLDAAGKTTILYKLRLNKDEVITTIPTVGFNVESVMFNRVKFNVWDVGGQDKIRPLWRHYYSGKLRPECGLKMDAWLQGCGGRRRGNVPRRGSNKPTECQGGWTDG